MQSPKILEVRCAILVIWKQHGDHLIEHLLYKVNVRKPDIPAVLHTYFLRKGKSLNFVGGIYLAIEKTDPRIQFFSNSFKAFPYMPTTISSST